MRRAIAIVGAVASFVLAAPATGWADDELYGITNASPPHLVSFVAPAAPTTITFTSNDVIEGLTPGDSVVGMDVSPRDGGLFLLAKNGTTGRLYSLDSTTA